MKGYFEISSGLQQKFVAKRLYKTLYNGAIISHSMKKQVIRFYINLLAETKKRQTERNFTKNIFSAYHCKVA